VLTSGIARVLVLAVPLLPRLKKEWLLFRLVTKSQRHCVLWALRNNESFRQPDALVLRLWGGPDKASWPLYEIAEKIVKADSKLSTGVQKIQN
jgi:hypothetical protein